MYSLKLTEFKSTDNILLPGLLYEPKRKTKKVAILLHGNGSSSVFYDTDEANTMAQYLTKAGIAYFPFNNRGAHYTKSLKRVVRGKPEKIKLGTSFELIKDCIKDIDGVINFLSKQGYKEFYLIGYSTGANKICVYSYYKPKNKIAGYVMVGGGDDTGIYYEMMGKKKFNLALKKAETEIKKGKGRDMISKDIIDYAFSYQALYDTFNPDGNYNTFPFNEYINNLKLSNKKLFREYKSIKKPSLVIYGGEDEYCYGDVSRVIDILKSECCAPDKFTFKIVKGADHGLSGYEKELAKIITNWLREKI